MSLFCTCIWRRDKLPPQTKFICTTYISHRSSFPSYKKIKPCPKTALFNDEKDHGSINIIIIVKM